MYHCGVCAVWPFGIMYSRREFTAMCIPVYSTRPCYSKLTQWMYRCQVNLKTNILRRESWKSEAIKRVWPLSTSSHSTQIHRSRKIKRNKIIFVRIMCWNARRWNSLTTKLRIACPDVREYTFTIQEHMRPRRHTSYNWRFIHLSAQLASHTHSTWLGYETRSVPNSIPNTCSARDLQTLFNVPSQSARVFVGFDSCRCAHTYIITCARVADWLNSDIYYIGSMEVFAICSSPRVNTAMRIKWSRQFPF